MRLRLVKSAMPDYASSSLFFFSIFHRPRNQVLFLLRVFFSVEDQIFHKTCRTLPHQGLVDDLLPHHYRLPPDGLVSQNDYD